MFGTVFPLATSQEHTDRTLTATTMHCKDVCPSADDGTATDFTYTITIHHHAKGNTQ